MNTPRRNKRGKNLGGVNMKKRAEAVISNRFISVPITTASRNTVLFTETQRKKSKKSPTRLKSSSVKV